MFLEELESVYLKNIFFQEPIPETVPIKSLVSKLYRV